MKCLFQIKVSQLLSSPIEGFVHINVIMFIKLVVKKNVCGWF